MTKQTAIKLLTDGKVALKGCKSKKAGKTYDTKQNPWKKKKVNTEKSKNAER